MYVPSSDESLRTLKLEILLIIGVCGRGDLAMSRGPSLLQYGLIPRITLQDSIEVLLFTGV